MAQILLFAGARMAVGTASFEFDAATVEDAIDEVLRRGGREMATLLPHCSVMLDATKIDDLQSNVDSNSEIAILPPVSGG